MGDSDGPADGTGPLERGHLQVGGVGRGLGREHGVPRRQDEEDPRGTEHSRSARCPIEGARRCAPPSAAVEGRPGTIAGVAALERFQEGAAVRIWGPGAQDSIGCSRLRPRCHGACQAGGAAPEEGRRAALASAASESSRAAGSAPVEAGLGRVARMTSGSADEGRGMDHGGGQDQNEAPRGAEHRDGGGAGRERQHGISPSRKRWRWFPWRGPSRRGRE
jgi:hypothetical protein